MAGRKRRNTTKLPETRNEERRRKARTKRTYKEAIKLRHSPALPLAVKLRDREYNSLKRSEGKKSARYYAKKEFGRVLYNPDYYSAAYPNGKFNNKSANAYIESQRKKPKDPKRVAAGKKAWATRQARGR